jgi:hypothetical protein
MLKTIKRINTKWALGVIVAIGLFSWVSVRPYVDRKHCNEYATAQVKSLGSPDNTRLFDLYERYYTLCVNASGLGD